MVRKIPFDFKASLNMPNWHKAFTAVIDERFMLDFYEQQEQRIVDYIQSLKNNEKRDNFLLSLPSLKSRLNGFVLVVLTLQNAQKKKIDLVSTLGEVNFLKTGDKQYLENKTTQILTEKPLKTYFFRRVVRTLTWTKWWKLLATILKPNVIAVGHNEILRQKAKSSKQRIYFYQASALLRKINQNNFDYKQPEYLYKLCEETYDVLLGDLKIENKYLDKFNYLVKDFIEDFLSGDAKALNECYQYSKLPKNIWIGTGIDYSFRLLALAVLRKGGKVTSFSHASWTVLYPSYKSFYFGEFAVTNEFVDITPASKNNFYSQYLKRFPTSLNDPFVISSLNKNTALSRYVGNTNIKETKQKPTVVYTSNAIKCLDIQDPMSDSMNYLKWQLDLTDILDKVNIDLICQPHPEGIFKDKKLIHPLREKYNIPYRSFETIIQQADVFLVDFIHSTTFGEMLVTDKPIVRIGWYDDNKFYGIPERLKSLMDKRCRNIEVDFDKNNLPVVDVTLLEKALTENWQEKVDSTKFRELLIG